MNLPPGFRFHPTDEELITHYLAPKIADSGSAGSVIGELDFHKFEPWDLPLSAKLGEEWYFFCIKDRKYPTGLRTNRATDAGYWKATGKDKEVHRRKSLIGMKKTLVFYKGRAPKGEKTDWVMHEYRVEGNYRSKLDKAWVICRVLSRSSGEKRDMEMMVDLRSWFEDELGSAVLLPSADEDQTKNKSFSVPDTIHVACFSNCLVGLDGSEELANCYNSPLLTNGDGHLQCQGDSSIKLFENHDHGSGKEVLVGNFNHEILLSDADVLPWN